jgi:hypothetical protein
MEICVKFGKRAYSPENNLQSSGQTASLRENEAEKIK